MFWLIVLAIISLVLLLAGSVNLVVISRRCRLREQDNRARAMVEMMKVADQAEEESGQGARTRSRH